jgi:hypothetical protein
MTARFQTREDNESETVGKLGGIESAGKVFRNSNLKALFQKFLDQTMPGKGAFDEGVPLKDGRRYLNFAAIVKLRHSSGNRDH